VLVELVGWLRNGVHGDGCVLFGGVGDVGVGGVGVLLASGFFYFAFRY
jgi:hypothetical protein